MTSKPFPEPTTRVHLFLRVTFLFVFLLCFLALEVKSTPVPRPGLTQNLEARDPSPNEANVRITFLHHAHLLSFCLYIFHSPASLDHLPLWVYCTFAGLGLRLPSPRRRRPGHDRSKGRSYGNDQGYSCGLVYWEAKLKDWLLRSDQTKLEADAETRWRLSRCRGGCRSQT